MSSTSVLIGQLSTQSYLGIFGVSLMANIIIPIPEEIVVLALGYVAGTGKANGFYLVPIVILGLLISDLVIYTLSKRGSKLTEWFYQKVFSKKLESRREWLESHIDHVIFFSRFLMQLRFLGPFFAGQTKVPIRKFITLELAALVIYVPFLIWAGGYFQNRIEQIIHGVGLVRNMILAVVGVFILIWMWKFIYRYVFKTDNTLKMK